MKALALISLFVLPVLHAQDTTSVAMEARRQSVVDLKSHIEMREQRLAEIATDIRALDDRNEKRIDSIVNTLKNLKDSEASKTRINALKGEVIAGLRKSITIYQGKRRDIFERLRSDKSAAVQALTGDLEKFDARTQKRVDQILELAKSMPASEEVEKYESTGGNYWNGWYEETSRISDEWKQNRRQGVATEKSLRELREALEKAIASLESRSASTADLLKNRNLSDAERAIQEQELGRINASLENRRKELVELSLPQASPDRESGNASTSDTYGKTTPSAAPKDNADEMKELLDDARKDISADFWTILRKYGEAATERDKIIAMKANLEAREKWLAENAPAGK
ncbi:MAG: hypothetical protein ABIS50_02060 [Luteolibacter sp.]|uniref:hypothetical protein n=1 Tax=Luteolibacter sp. TaxID=1962973 RepID=UPI003266F136